MTKLLSQLLADATIKANTFMVIFRPELTTYKEGESHRLPDVLQDCREALTEIAYLPCYVFHGEVYEIDVPITIELRLAFVQAATAMMPLERLSSALPEIGEMLRKPAGTTVTSEDLACLEPLVSLIEEARCEVVKFLCFVFTASP